jgi:hypothetical protein
VGAKEAIRGDHEPARALLEQGYERSIEVSFSTGVQNEELQPEGAGRGLQAFQL